MNTPEARLLRRSVAVRSRWEAGCDRKWCHLGQWLSPPPPPPPPLPARTRTGQLPPSLHFFAPHFFPLSTSLSRPLSSPPPTADSPPSIRFSFYHHWTVQRNQTERIPEENSLYIFCTVCMRLCTHTHTNTNTRTLTHAHFVHRTNVSAFRIRSHQGGKNNPQNSSNQQARMLFILKCKVFDSILLWFVFFFFWFCLMSLYFLPSWGKNTLCLFFPISNKNITETSH